ncbi:hypothetical protein D3C78_1517100 [compost metagenome]
MLRATMAVCEVLPPTAVTKPAKTLLLKCSMSAGDRSCATRISGTSGAVPGKTTAALRGAATGLATPFMCRRMRSTTCSRSALRSRR